MRNLNSLTSLRGRNQTLPGFLPAVGRYGSRIKAWCIKREVPALVGTQAGTCLAPLKLCESNVRQDILPFYVAVRGRYDRGNPLLINEEIATLHCISLAMTITKKLYIIPACGRQVFQGFLKLNNEN